MKNEEKNNTKGIFLFTVMFPPWYLLIIGPNLLVTGEKFSQSALAMFFPQVLCRKFSARISYRKTDKVVTSDLLWAKGNSIKRKIFLLIGKCSYTTMRNEW